MIKIVANSVDEFLTQCDQSIIEKLEEIRQVLIESLPNIEETISYGLPTYKHKTKVILHFGPAKKHLGFYPGPQAIIKFENQIKQLGFKYSKGCIQIPYDNPLPIPLIKDIIQFRIKSIEEEILIKSSINNK